MPSRSRPHEVGGLAYDISENVSVAARIRKGRLRLDIAPAVVALAVLLLVLIVPPALYLIASSFFTTGYDGSFAQPTLRHYRELVGSPHFVASLANTLVYGLGSAVVALTLGVVQALIVERTNTPGRHLVVVGVVASLGIPYVLYLVAWLLLLGRSGPVNDLIQLAGGSTIDVHSMWGMVAIEGVGSTPLTFLLMSALLRSADPAFEEASMVSGAGVLNTLRLITLRMARPGIMALALLLFIRAFESFEVPALVGLAGNINVLTTDIYQSSLNSGRPDYGQSGAYSVCLLAIVALLLFWHHRLSREARKFQTITGKGYRPHVIDLGRLRYMTAAVLVLIFSLVTLLPLAMLVFASLQPFYEGVTANSFARFTLDNYQVVLAGESLGPAIRNTLVLGAAAACVVVPLTALCAWLAVRRWPGAWLLDQIAMTPLVFPAIVMSVAFLQVFVNLTVIPLYGTLLSVIIASATRYLPYGMRYAYAGILQIHADLEAAATVSGAGSPAVFIRVVTPLIATALIGCWLFVFLSCVQSVALPLLLVGPGTEVIAVLLFDLWQNGQVTELAAVGVLWSAFMLAVSACFYLATKHYRVFN
jgi:iron(III) transport system permease protein